jgi:hypothetical protein
MGENNIEEDERQKDVFHRLFRGEMIDKSHYSDLFLDLLREMLANKDRLSALELLGHPIFRNAS